jgi:hypothetical protein
MIFGGWRSMENPTLRLNTPQSKPWFFVLDLFMTRGPFTLVLFHDPGMRLTAPLFLFTQVPVASQLLYRCLMQVTGSNSVNVFLGIGMPWLLASFYWYLQALHGTSFALVIYPSYGLLIICQLGCTPPSVNYCWLGWDLQCKLQLPQFTGKTICLIREILPAWSCEQERQILVDVSPPTIAITLRYPFWSLCASCLPMIFFSIRPM